MEAMVSVRAAYGTIVEELKDVSRSYKEADMALEVGRVFYADKNILAYNELGIGRLIYQLPHSAVRDVYERSIRPERPDTFDEETLTTINKFFENNLNISETSGKAVCMCTEIHWCTVWRRSRRAQDWMSYI